MFETCRSDPEFGDVSGVVLAHLLGQRLGDLGAVEDSVAGDAELVDVALGLARVEAWAQAQRARVTQLLVGRTRSELERHGRARHGDSHGTAAGASHRYDDERLAERAVSTDLALALGITPWAADRDLELAAGLARHPGLGRALAAGRLDRRRAELVLDEVATLADPAARERVVSMVVGDGRHDAERPEHRSGLIRPLRRAGTHLHQVAPGVLRHALRRECAALDPEGLIAREAAARAGRRVELAPLPDCMAELRIIAPAHAIAAASTNLDLAARAARRRGDGRTLDQLRCDIGIGWLTEGAFGTLVTRTAAKGESGPDPLSRATTSTPTAAATATTGWSTSTGTAFETAVLARSGLLARRDTTPVYVDDDRLQVELPRPAGALIVITMPDHSARGLSDEPATLHGPGGPVPMPAPLARRIAHDERDATWVGLYTDPRTGVATDLSRSYRPPPRQRTFLALRDGLRSRLPSSPVRRVELDHVRPYDHDRPTRGGQTTPADLACLGLREHHLKTDGMLAVAGDANGPLTFTTHTGHQYVSWPELWEDPVTYANLEVTTRRAEPVGDPVPPY